MRPIKIGSLTYDVTIVPDLAGSSGTLCGRINAARCCIQINADDHPQVQHVTLWHEVIHGILFHAGLTEHDERIVDAIAYGVVQVLHDNPSLAVPQAGTEKE